MQIFEQLLKENVERYEGPHQGLIRLAPELYGLMTRLLEDPNLPGRLRPLVMAAIGYFVLPTEILAEDLQGPAGYADDLFLCAFVANRVRQVTGSAEILDGNWEGETPISDLLHQIAAQEKDLIGDQRDLILWYIGYEYLDPQSA